MPIQFFIFCLFQVSITTFSPKKDQKCLALKMVYMYWNLRFKKKQLMNRELPKGAYTNYVDTNGGRGGHENVYICLHRGRGVLSKVYVAFWATFF